MDGRGFTALDYAAGIKPVNIAIKIIIMLLKRGAKTGAEIAYRAGIGQPAPAAAQPKALPPLQILQPQTPAAAKAGVLREASQQTAVGQKRKETEPAQPRISPLPPMQILPTRIPAAAQPIVPEGEEATEVEEPVTKTSKKGGRKS